MSLYSFRRQCSYPNGELMCTTACMQVAMALLCRQISLPLRNVSYESVVQKIDECMRVGSIVHGNVETIIRRLRAKDSGSQPGLVHRMISVNELISMLRIDLKGLGVCMEELVVPDSGGGGGVSRAKLTLRKSPSGTPRRGLTRCHHEDAQNRPKYQASSCFIALQQLPLCMEMDDDAAASCSSSATPHGEEIRPLCVALVTANGHTVCCASYGDGLFAFFDSLPGRFAVGLSGHQMIEQMQAALSICTSGTETPGTVPAPEGDNRRDAYGRCVSSRESSPPKASVCDITLLYMDKN